MKHYKKIFLYILAILTLISATTVLSFADNSAGNGWGVASWYCEQNTSAFVPDYALIEQGVIAKCNKDWNTASQEEWNDQQYETFLILVEQALEKATEDYNKENVSYDIAVSFSMPEDQTYLYDYVMNCKPYVYITKNGEFYSKTPLKLMQKDSESAIAVLTVNGYGNYEGMICHNETDGVPTAQSADYESFSTIALSVYESGMKCKYTNKMNNATAEEILSSLQGGNQAALFDDVSIGAWYYKNVLLSAQQGLIAGKTETTFCPDDNMTYAEAITLAARMKVDFNGGNPETDFQANRVWYQPYVDYAKENGIPWEYKNYNANISREDYVHIFYAALPENQYKAINIIADGTIPDVSMNHKYADEIYTFYRAGILSGSDEARSFKPKDFIKRSEVAAILCRMMGEDLQSFSL